MTHEIIEEIEKKFKAFCNEHINDYHGEEAWVYTKPALETAIEVNIADTLERVRDTIRTIELQSGSDGHLYGGELMRETILQALTPTPVTESGIYLKECIDKI